MKIIYTLYRNRNGGKYVDSNEDFCKKSSSQAMWRVPMRVAICFLAHLQSQKKRPGDEDDPA